MEKQLVIEGDVFIPWSYSDDVTIGDNKLVELIENNCPNGTKVRITIEVLDTDEA